MLGWHFNFFRKPEELEWEDHRLESGQVYSRTPKLPHEERFCSWDATMGGLDWLDALVEGGRASLLATNGGYPLVYELELEDLEKVLAAPPHLRGKVSVLEQPTYSRRIIAEVWDQS